MVILADTNIPPRTLHPPAPDRAAVLATVRRLRADRGRVVTFPQNIAEFWNVCTRPEAARGGYGLSDAKALRRPTRIEVLYAMAATHDTWRQLVITHGVPGKQVRDARLVALMAGHDMTHVVTLNAKDFARYPGLAVIDPAAP